MNKIYIAVALMPGIVVTSSAYAQSVGNLAGAPVVAAGNVLSTASANHAQIAPTVNRLSPTVEPVTDGVTNVLGAAGTGVSGTGQRIRTNGVQVGSASIGSQSVGGTLRSAQSNGVLLGTSAGGRPLVSVGASSSHNQGTIVAAVNGR